MRALVALCFVAACGGSQEATKQPAPRQPDAVPVATPVEPGESELNKQIDELEAANDLVGAANATEQLVARMRKRQAPPESLATQLHNLGRAQYMAGQPDKAEKALLEGLTLATADDLRGDLNYQLGGVLNDLGRHEAAVAAHREAVTLYEKSHGPTAVETVSAMEALAGSLGGIGKHEEGETLLRQVVKVNESRNDDGKLLGLALVNLAKNLTEQKQHDEALRLLARAIKVLESTKGFDRAKLAEAHASVSSVHFDRGRYREAVASQRKALEIRIATLGDEHISVAYDHHNLALFLQYDKKLPEALVECRRAETIRRAKLAPDHPLLVDNSKLCATLAK